MQTSFGSYPELIPAPLLSNTQNKEQKPEGAPLILNNQQFKLVSVNDLPQQMRVTLDGKLIMVEAPQDRKYRSCCAGFFIREEGVISLSLKTLTLVGSLTTTAALFIMLYITCRDDLLNIYHDIPVSEACSFRHHNPMVSDVICLPFFDRIWCILTTFFALSVM